MATVSEKTGLVSVSAAERARIRQMQKLVASPEFVRMVDTIEQVRRDLPGFQSRAEEAWKAHEELLGSVALMSSRQGHFNPQSEVGRWLDLLSIPKSVEGLQYALFGMRNALRAVLNLGSYLRQLANKRDRHGLAPGKVVATHPQVTRGPNVCRSILRSSADLVVGA